MKYKYKFWSKVLTPIDRVLNKLGYYIVFRYNENQSDLFDTFDSFHLIHKSKINEL